MMNFILNVGNHLPSETASHPKRPESSANTVIRSQNLADLTAIVLTSAYKQVADMNFPNSRRERAQVGTPGFKISLT
jgi:hypothetical protein